MAKLFKQPIFLLAVSVFVLATASPKGHDDDSKPKIFSLGQKHEEDDSKLSLTLTRKKSDDSSSAADDKNCKCDNELKDFVDKFVFLFRAYASKELAPEIRSMVLKVSDFVLSYLAKEKPEDMDKIHSFLQSSVKITGDAVAKGGKAKRDVASQPQIQKL